MRIATWNINGIRARLDYVRHWLESRQPDVVALQELKVATDQFPHDAFEDLGYQAAVHGQKAWNGVAILSRRPLRELASGLPGQDTMGARLITAEVDDLVITNLYCPNGKHLEHDDFAAKLAWYDDLIAALEPGSGSPIARTNVLCGDFNICPGERDTWDEARMAGGIFHTDAERSRIQRLHEHGLVDLYRHAFPKGRDFSWWDYRGGAFHRNLGLRIDFVLASRHLVQRLERVEIDRDYRKKKDGLTASDHAPVIADLEPGATDD